MVERSRNHLVERSLERYGIVTENELGFNLGIDLGIDHGIDHEINLRNTFQNASMCS